MIFCVDCVGDCLSVRDNVDSTNLRVLLGVYVPKAAYVLGEAGNAAVLSIIPHGLLCITNAIGVEQVVDAGMVSLWIVRILNIILVVSNETKVKPREHRCFIVVKISSDFDVY